VDAVTAAHAPSRTASATAFYRTIWRWHFYAGLFVMPFILILSVTGAIFLFKPQLDRWQESSFRGLSGGAMVTPEAQRDAALAAFPGARFDAYRLPELPGDAPAIHVALPDGTMRNVYVSPQGKVLGSLDPDAMISSTVARIHGTLLAGKAGSWLVELAGSWAIVMVLTGLYLWWPSGRVMAGVVWPRGGRAFWRDLHAVTGFWVSGLALILLVTALPWAGVWGAAFKSVRSELGWVKGAPDWKIGAGDHAEHDHATMAATTPQQPVIGLNDMVAKAEREALAFPVLVKPAGANNWTIKSEAQNRPLRVTITFDAQGRETSRVGQADKHPIDQAVAYGIAWHEGALFGWINQLIGLLTTIALVTLMVSGFILWRRRKPAGVLGAPPVPAVPPRVAGVVAILLVLAALLPLLAASLILLWLVERLILPRLPTVSRWLGLRHASG